MNEDYYPIYKVWSVKWAVVNIRHPDDAEVNIFKHYDYDNQFNYYALHLIIFPFNSDLVYFPINESTLQVRKIRFYL